MTILVKSWELILNFTETWGTKIIFNPNIKYKKLDLEIVN